MFLKLLTWTLIGVVVQLPIVSSAEDSRLGESRKLTDSFAEKLSSELKLAMSKGGPLQAVQVCKERAPKIASELSRTSGAKVSRTSRRYRNPANIPEPWQLSVLEDFELKTENTNDQQLLEYFEPGDSSTPARYVRAIHTKGLCLACHGSTIPEAVSQRLKVEYPYDRATGYQLGELRGAFVVSWPLIKTP